MQRTKPAMKLSRQQKTIPIHYPASTYQQPWPHETGQPRKTTSVSFAKTKSTGQENGQPQKQRDYINNISCPTRRSFYNEQKSLSPKAEMKRRLLSEIPTEAPHLKYGVFNRNRRKTSDVLVTSHAGNTNLYYRRRNSLSPVVRARVQSVGVMAMIPKEKPKPIRSPKKKSLPNFKSNNVQNNNTPTNKRRIKKGPFKPTKVNSRLICVPYKKNLKKCIHYLSYSQTMHIDIKPSTPLGPRIKSPNVKSYCVPISQLPSFDCYRRPIFLRRGSLSSTRNNSPTRRSSPSLSIASTDHF